MKYKITWGNGRKKSVLDKFTVDKNGKRTDYLYYDPYHTYNLIQIRLICKDYNKTWKGYPGITKINIENI